MTSRFSTDVAAASHVGHNTGAAAVAGATMKIYLRVANTGSPRLSTVNNIHVQLLQGQMTVL